MASHQFVPGDIDEDYCEECDRHIDKHPNIEGITYEDDIVDFGDTLTDIKGRYAFREDW